MQSSAPKHIDGVDIGAVLDEQFQDARIALPRRLHQRGRATLVALLDVCVQLNEQGDSRSMPALHSEHENRVTRDVDAMHAHHRFLVRRDRPHLTNMPDASSSSSVELVAPSALLTLPQLDKLHRSIVMLMDVGEVARQRGGAQIPVDLGQLLFILGKAALVHRSQRLQPHQRRGGTSLGGWVGG